MNTENETWRDASSAKENTGAEHDGNQFNGDYGNLTPYGNSGQDNGENAERPRRPRFNASEKQYAYSSDRNYRPRFNPNADNAGDNANRPYRPRYNNYNNDGGERRQRMYGNNFHGNNATSYGNEAQQRPYRPRYNQGTNDNTQRPSPYDNNGGNNRPYRPRFNSYDNDNGSERRPRPYGSNDMQQRPYRPRFNQNNDNNAPQRNSSYGNYNGGERNFRPRFNANYGNRQGYCNSYNNNRPNNKRPAYFDQNNKPNRKKQIEYQQEVIDPNEPIRLNKYLANAGVCSRREADEFISAGVVSVNGNVVTELGTKIKYGDEVKFREQVVNIERKIYVLLNKPKDTVTTSDDPQARRTVMDLVKGACPERIYPVGRLDRNTTGVLLLTNDGDLASKLTHPKFLKKKIYQVRLDKDLSKADMDKIAAGIQLDDGEIHADAISYTDENKKSDIGIEIHSGKNRIVRRIFESLGYKVLKLDRVYFAGLTKKGLRRGDWRFLTEQEVNYLRMGSFE